MAGKKNRAKIINLNPKLAWVYLLKKIRFKKAKEYVFTKVTSIKNGTLILKKYVIFYSFFVRLRFLNFFRYTVSQFISKHRFLIGSLAYFTSVLVVSYLFNLNVRPRISNSDAITFFTASGAMIGGILTIIFALSILLMDKAEKIPVGFYDIAAKDRTHNIIYILISACSLTMFAFAIAYGNLHTVLSWYSFEASLILISFAFYLVFTLYQRVLNKLNPNYILKEVNNLALKELEKVKKRAEEIAEVLSRDPVMDAAITRQTILAKSFQFFKPDIEKINSVLNYLYDYHDRLVSNREQSSASSVLQIIESILLKYFEIRKESSVALPSGFLLVSTSDSRDFLTPVLERLLSIGEEYMRTNNNVGTTKVIHIFKDLCVVASDITYALGRSSENPILEQCRGYLDQLMDSAVKLGSLEGTFQGAIAYKELGIIAIRKTLHHEMSPILNTLEEISISGLANRQDAVLGESINTYNTILSELVLSSRFNLEIELKSAMKKLQNIILLAFMSVAGGGLQGNYLTQTSLALPFEILRDCIFELARRVERGTTPRDIDRQKRKFFQVVEENRRTLRFLSEKMKNADHILINTFGSIIADIGELMLELSTNPKWSSEKSELHSQVAWYVHQPKWFTHDVEKIKSNLAFDSLVDAVSKIGMKALLVDDNTIATEAVKIIKVFAVEMLEKEDNGRSRFGFTEPRIMEEACYIGVLALKLGRTGVVNVVKAEVAEFEAAYISKWFPDDRDGTSPKRNQLMLELLQLADEAGEGTSRLLDDARERFLFLVTKEDIEAFVFAMWGVRVEN